jgi:hypothetical protein
MRFFLLVLISLLITPAYAAETPPPKTIIHDQAEADQLLGRHLLGAGHLYNFGWTTSYVWFGEYIAKNKNGTYDISGKNECYWLADRSPHEMKGGYFKISGIITEILNQRFTLNGRIESSYFYGTNITRKECVLEGKFIFSRKSHPAYWSIIKHDAKLEGDPDYCQFLPFEPDLFVKLLEEEPPHYANGGCERSIENIKPFTH